MMEDKAYYKSLRDIEGRDLPFPLYQSYLCDICSRLWKTPLEDFTIEDIRVMLSQKLGLSVLVPMAIKIIENNPLAQGDFYPGDLLITLLTTCDNYISIDNTLQERIKSVVNRAIFLIDQKEIIDDDKYCYNTLVNYMKSSNR